MAMKKLEINMTVSQSGSGVYHCYTPEGEDDKIILQGGLRIQDAALFCFGYLAAKYNFHKDLASEWYVETLDEDEAVIHFALWRNE